jgi:subtilisin family serine protease
MILSTYPTHPMGDDDKNDDAQEPSDPVAFNDGTSMAAPHVSGAAALLWSLHPEATYGEIKAALLNGVESGPFRVKSRGSLYLPEALDWLELSKN